MEESDKEYCVGIMFLASAKREINSSENAFILPRISWLLSFLPVQFGNGCKTNVLHSLFILNCKYSNDCSCLHSIPALTPYDHMILLCINNYNDMF